MLRHKLVLLLIVLCALAGVPVHAALEKGMTVLVTGANRGIGLEFASQLKAAGYNVIGTARKPAEAVELKALGVRVEQLDVTDTDSVADLAAALADTPLDLVINNAGVGGQGVNKLAKIDFEQMARTFNVNSAGPLRVTQGLQGNLAAGKGKTVVHISSIMGSIENNKGGYYSYRASKAALNMLNKSLAAELGKQGFVCVVMHPGWVKTRMGGEAAPVQPQDSVAGMLKVISGLQAADNGRFFDYQGQELP